MLEAGGAGGCHRLAAVRTQGKGYWGWRCPGSVSLASGFIDTILFASPAMGLKVLRQPDPIQTEAPCLTPGSVGCMGWDFYRAQVGLEFAMLLLQPPK